jgi:metal-responsive CopG/Arc/MetJ family transcriptional regulator
MKYKTEIKVYLPVQMVGELHQQKLNGNRSKFIEQAIWNRIDGRDNELKLSDLKTAAIMHFLRENRKSESIDLLTEWLK